MSIQGNALFTGSFTSDGNARVLDFGTTISAYMQLNQTQFNSVANPGVLKRAWFIQGMANGSYFGVKNTNGAATDESIFAATNGFTPFDSSNLPTFGATAITSVSQANPAVVTAVAHGLVTGDIVRLVNVTNMQQVSGFLFSVTVTGVNTFTIPLDSSLFSAPGAGGTVRKVFLNPFILKERTITNVTQAVQAVVTTSVNHGYSVGDMVSFRIPLTGYGMQQLNPTPANSYLRVEIVAVGSASTFTVNLDTTTFTAFTFPTSANAYLQSRPQVVPVGAAGTSPNFLLDATDNTGILGLSLGSALVGTAGDVIRFWAFSGTDINLL
jgi:hypothetical protein